MLISSEFPPGPGGIGSHAYQLAAHLARLGWKITVVAPQDYAQEPEIARFTAGLAFSLSRVTSGRGRAREAWNRVRVAQRLMKQVRPDILIGTGLSGVMGCLDGCRVEWSASDCSGPWVRVWKAWENGGVGQSDGVQSHDEDHCGQ
jgi:hypothetical protein